MTKEHILICDDEADLRQTLGEYLEKRGYRVSLAADGEELDACLASGDADAMILDINMPGEDGLGILRRVRGTHRLGIIMLTASGELIDRIVGLELGADDYLPKPVSFRELEARLRAVLRRLTEARAIPVETLGEQESEDMPPIRFAGFVLDRKARRLIGPTGAEIVLTPLEFRLIQCLAERPGRVLTRDQLLEFAHDRDWDPLDRSIDIRVSKLRRKIEANPRKPVLIRTVRGVGYVFDPGSGSA